MKKLRHREDMSMRECSHCLHESLNTEEQCPHCGADFPVGSKEPCADSMPETASLAETTPFEPIARFANIAEAGYFHSELEGRLECDVRLNTQDHFDAPSASWWSDYVLTVPAANTQTAVAALKDLVAETDQSEFLDLGTEPPAQRMAMSDEEFAPSSRIHWTPIVLTLAAGTFVFWAAKQAQLQFRGAGDRKAHGVSLWDMMSESDQPWVQRSENGGGRREISIDPNTNMATLREDTDGDGVVDRVSQLPLSSR